MDIAKETSCEKDEENLFNKLDEIIYETDIDKNYNIELELNSYDEETRKDFKINDDEQFIKMWIYRKDEDLEKINELTNNLINKYQLRFAQCEEDVSSDCKQYIIGNKISRTIIIIGKDLEKVIDILLEFKK